MEALQKFCLIIVILFLFEFDGKFCYKGNSWIHSVNLKNAKLVLYQGKERFVLQGKFCSSGIYFIKPEKFSCACVTGVWAFYNIFCDKPLIVIGGVNNCFKIPDEFIQQIILVSSPTKVLEKALTIFKGDLEEINLKYVNEKGRTRSKFGFSNFSAIVVNSSWSILDDRKDSGICLDIRNPLTYISKSDNAIPKNLEHSSFTCTFKNLTTNYIEGTKDTKNFEPGSCSNFPKTKIINPTSCFQMKISKNNENFCKSPEILNEFEVTMAHYSFNKKRDPFFPYYKKKVNGSVQNIKREPEDVKKDNTKNSNKNISESDQNGNKNRWLNFKENLRFLQRKAGNNKPEREYKYKLKQQDKNNLKNLLKSNLIVNTEELRNKSSAEIIEEINGLLKEKDEDFLKLEMPKSERLIMNQIWEYEKEEIAKIYKIRNKSHQNETFRKSQLYSLLEISKFITQKICSNIVSESIFNLSLEIFSDLQTNYFHPKEIYLNHFDFLRISRSLDKCKKRALSFVFKQDLKGCNQKNITGVLIGNEEKPLKVSKILDSKGLEPIIEIVWKLVVNAHSYCYMDFNDFHNDHNRFSDALSKAFTYGLHPFWIRDLTIVKEYGEVLGDVESVLRNLDYCTTASRLVSGYPWDLKRPTNFDQNDQFLAHFLIFPRPVYGFEETVVLKDTPESIEVEHEPASSENNNKLETNQDQSSENEGKEEPEAKVKIETIEKNEKIPEIVNDEKIVENSKRENQAEDNKNNAINSDKNEIKTEPEKFEDKNSLLSEIKKEDKTEPEKVEDKSSPLSEIKNDEKTTTTAKPEENEELDEDFVFDMGRKIGANKNMRITTKKLNKNKYETSTAPTIPTSTDTDSSDSPSPNNEKESPGDFFSQLDSYSLSGNEKTNPNELKKETSDKNTKRIKKRSLVSQESEKWKKQRKVLYGKGYCLKKPEDSKKYLGLNC